MEPQVRERAAQSVVRVDGGRGFVVGGGYVITAAHCLPTVPPPHLARYLQESTYPKLLGPLGKRPKVWAACAFVDTMADIAVLGSPDNQALTDEAEEYDALVEELPAMPLAVPPFCERHEEIRLATAFMAKLPPDEYVERLRQERASRAWRAWLLALDGHWFDCAAAYTTPYLAITNGDERVVSDMAGSPVVTADGAALALVSTGSNRLVCPGLIDNLPGWLLDATLGDANPRRRAGSSPPP